VKALVVANKRVANPNRTIFGKGDDELLVVKGK
jgi:hypothetical protein